MLDSLCHTSTQSILPKLPDCAIYGKESVEAFSYNPLASGLQVVHAYAAGEVPDGIRFGASGNLYVALALVPQAAPSFDFLGGVDILTQDGVQINRLLTSNGQGPNYFNPANMAFDDKRRAIVVTNHGFTCDLNAIDSCNFNAIRVYVDDKGAKEY
jgi:hypothetical protein